jgi:hypothetical protein
MNYTLNLSSEHVRLALAAMAELPYKMAAPAIESIMKQTDEQEAAAAQKASSGDAQPAV